MNIYDVLRAAKERWPSHAIPYGGKSALARELGLPAPTVKSWLLNAGFSTVYRDSPTEIDDSLAAELAAIERAMEEVRR